MAGQGAVRRGHPKGALSNRSRQQKNLGEKTMCDIGKPIEMIDVEPLSLPKPLRREQEQPEEQPVTIEVPVTAEATLVEQS
jgi:hypothetical protein